jgi:hypothetical protein
MNAKTFAQILIKFSGLVWLLMGVCGTASSLIDAIGQLDWTFLDIYLRARLVPPSLEMLTGILLILFSKSVVEWLMRDTSI